MNNILYDIKISPLFNGTITYKKHDYLDDEVYIHEFHFQDGKIRHVSIYIEGSLNDENPFDLTGMKFSEGDKWNSNFWVKAPKYANYDSCRWERVDLWFNNDFVTARPHNYIIVSP